MATKSRQCLRPPARLVSGISPASAAFLPGAGTRIVYSSQDDLHPMPAVRPESAERRDPMPSLRSRLPYPPFPAPGFDTETPPPPAGAGSRRRPGGGGSDRLASPAPGRLDGGRRGTGGGIPRYGTGNPISTGPRNTGLGRRQLWPGRATPAGGTASRRSAATALRQDVGQRPRRSRSRRSRRPGSEPR